MIVTNKKKFVIFLGLALASCSLNKAANEQQKIRIVDMQGKAHPVQTRVPELNAQILASQGKFEQRDESLKEGLENKSFEEVAQNKYSQVEPNKIVPQNSPQNFPLEQNFVDNSPTNIDYGFIAPEGMGKNPVPDLKASALPKTTELKEEDQMRANVGVGQMDDGSQNEFDISDKKNPVVRSVVGSGKKYVMTHPKQETTAPKEENFTAKSRKGYFVQVGSFSNQSSAKRSLGVMKKYHNGVVEEANSGGKTVYRALLGPFSNKQKAADLVRKITASGHDAIIVKNR